MNSRNNTAIINENVSSLPESGSVDVTDIRSDDFANSVPLPCGSVDSKYCEVFGKGGVKLSYSCSVAFTGNVLLSYTVVAAGIAFTYGAPLTRPVMTN